MHVYAKCHCRTSAKFSRNNSHRFNPSACSLSLSLLLHSAKRNAPQKVNIDIEDVNDNAPEFDAQTVRISVPENAELNTPLYAAQAHDRDSGKSGSVTYRLLNGPNIQTSSTADSSSSSASIPATSLFSIDSRSGHLTLSRHLDYETAQRHQLLVLATDGGEPALSANLTVLVEVQDVNDNAPVFERHEYAVKVIESQPMSSQVSFV